jgi:hypothetical protein
MRKTLLIAAIFISAACAQTTFHAVDRNATGKITRDVTSKKNVGLVYYHPVPHLMVQRPLNKDGATTAKIVYLPDTANPMAMRFKGGFGSSSMNVTLTNGMIASFNQDFDSKIPELLANLSAPVTGLATADATRATASLTQAQEAQIRAAIKSGAGAASLVPPDKVDAEGKRASDRCNPGSGDWLGDPANPNSEVVASDRAIIVSAANGFACASEKLMDVPLGTKASESLETAKRLMYIISDDYEQDANTQWLLFVLGKNPISTPLNMEIKPYLDIELGDGPKLTEIEDLLQASASEVKNFTSRIDPPTPSTPKAPFELYRIDVNGKKTVLTKVPG